MKYSIVYSKDNGNTKLLSEALKEVLTRSNKELVYYGLPSSEALEADVIFCGFWAFQCPLTDN